MNADEQNLNPLLSQLEQATSNAPDRAAATDPQTAALGEAWSLLGQLLQAAEAESPSRVAWDELQVPPPPAPVAKPVAWKRPAALAVAVTLLLGLGLAWSWWRTPGGTVVAKTTTKTTTVAPAPVRTDNPVIDLAWDETIDTEIAAAKQQMLAVEQEWCFLSNATYPVYGRMQEIQQEMSNGSM
jgi:hypothetical protein